MKGETRMVLQDYGGAIGLGMVLGLVCAVTGALMTMGHARLLMAGAVLGGLVGAAVLWHSRQP